MYVKKEAEKIKIFELEKTRIEVSSLHDLTRRGVKKDHIESQMVRSLKLIPEFDEKTVTEWFGRFEKQVAEFDWLQEEWVGLVANMLKGKALKVYDWMAVEDLEDHEELKTS